MRYSLSCSPPPPCSSISCTVCFIRSRSSGCTTLSNWPNFTGSDSVKPNNLLHLSVTQSSSSWIFQTHRPTLAASPQGEGSADEEQEERYIRGIVNVIERPDDTFYHREWF